MRNLFLASILLVTSGGITIAQQTNHLSISSGSSSSSSETKKKAFTGNGYNLQAEVFIPFLHSGGSYADATSKFALGAIAGGTYYNSKNLTTDPASTRSAYKLYSGELDINSEKGGASNTGFTATAGLQAVFALGSISLSPSVSGGFFSLKQKGFVQQAAINGKSVALAGLPAAKHTGFVTIPQVRISYPVAATLHLYASGALLTGPEISMEQLTLVPAGGTNDQHTYEPSQLSSGRMQSSTVQTNYRALNINVGVSFGFGSASRRLKGKVTKPGDNGAMNKTKNPLYKGGGHSGENPLYNGLVAAPGQPIGGIVVKGGKNPGGSMMIISSDDHGGFELTGLEAGNYQFQLTAPDQPQEKSISEKGLKRVEAAAMAKPGQPIGGIVVKGGKNPGGSMINLAVDNNGTIQFEVLEAGDYKFIIQTPEEPGQQKTKKPKDRATSGLKDTLKTNV
jgi:hypothetical protein